MLVFQILPSTIIMQYWVPNIWRTHVMLHSCTNMKPDLLLLPVCLQEKEK
jgi:hypothetical protein